MKNNYASYITLLLLLFFCVSCENEEGVVGSSIIVNENHNIVSYPTDEATASFIQYANILASETGISLLGYYNDNVFGTQYGTCAFQIRPDSLIEGTITDISEISLTVPYLGFYADESITEDMITTMAVNVSTVINSLDNSNNLHVHQDDIVSNLECGIDIDNSMISSAESTGNLTLDLTSCLKSSILNSCVNSNSKDLNTFQDGFLNTFYGIILRPEMAQNLMPGGMMILNTNDAILDVQYSNDTGENNSMEFEIGSDELINLTFLTNNFTNLDTTNNIYLQSMGGSYSEIDMQFLTSLKEEGYIAVNNAELIFHVSENNGNFPLPDNLRLYQFADNEIIDFANATPIAESDNINTENQSYIFDMTGMIHEIINGEREPIFQLHLNSPTSEMNRLLLDNPFELNLLLIKEDN